MSMALLQSLANVEVTEGSACGALQVFGLRWTAGPELPYITLDEALETGKLEVTEVSQAGSVPTLTVANASDTLVFLMAGEQLIGAKQNRVLNASIMVPAKTRLPVPVSCVERGRWGYRSPTFWSKGSSSHGKLRAAMSRSSSAAYKMCGRPQADQSEVWRMVDHKLMDMGSFSDSDALEQAYDDHRSRL